LPDPNLATGVPASTATAFLVLSQASYPDGRVRKLLLIRPDLVAEQLPRLGFELVDECEVAFSVPV